LDGHETTKRLKAHAALRHTPVIAVTASSFREEEAKARKICDGFIRKPFNRSELIGELKRFLKPLAQTETEATPAMAAPQAVAAAPISAGALARRPEILAKLREQEQQVWPKLVRTLPMAKVEEFARRLKNWAQEGSGTHYRTTPKRWNGKRRNLIWTNYPKPSRSFPTSATL
jgi:response regulator RpfG family c-di-GMP phosphodiesterase